MSRSNESRLVLIVPAYNEEHRLGDGSYFRQIQEQGSIRFIFVNDGSTDQTASLLKNLCHQVNGRVIDLEQNSGKAEAIRQGLLISLDEDSFEYVGFLDCDRAFSVDSVSDFIKKAKIVLSTEKSIDAVISSRIKLSGREVLRKASRHYISRILITLIGFSVPNLPYDSQSGLKIFRKTTQLEDALSRPFSTKWFFDIELFIRTNWLEENRVWEEPVISWVDIDGSHLNWKKFPGLLREIWKIIKIGRANR